MKIDEDEFKPLLELVGKITIYKSFHRKDSAGVGRSLVFGKGRVRKKPGLVDFINNTRQPEIYKEILRLKQIICNDKEYNVIVLNHNFECQLHTDKNKSDSIAIGFGNYEGGNLVIDDVPNNIKYNSVKFNGNQSPHYVSPITFGNRYSLIFTNH
jgi:hypothetical protein